MYNYLTLAIVVVILFVILKNRKDNFISDNYVMIRYTHYPQLDSS